MAYIELNKKAFFHNLDLFSKVCGLEKLCIALKDNAYGHGITEVATMCQEYGIKHVFVRNLTEAAIAKRFDFETILVLYDMPLVKDDAIIVSINSLDALLKVPKGSKIELKIDTGMNRNGIEPKDISEAIDLISENELLLNGVFTHFCCADEENEITQKQEKRFLDAVESIKKSVKHSFRIHCANTHGVFKVDMNRYDLARIGIGAYGYIEFKDVELQPVMSLYAQKISTKSVQKGDHIGYGSKAYIADKDMIVSNYDIGYGDGFLRLSENKRSFIADKKEIIGRISMDSLFVEADDEKICIFDDVSDLAKTHSTIEYEILATLNPYIKRVIV